MINIGDALILETKYSNKIEKYKCKLVERRGQQLYIDYPINLESNKTAYLLDGTQLKCSFVSQEGTVYMFETEVTGRVKQNIPMLTLLYPGNERLIKIQRRQFVRVETAVDVAVHPMNLAYSAFTTVTDDISAGGAAILASNAMLFKNGQQLSCYFVFPMQNGEYHYYKFLSKVVRVIPLDKTRNKLSLQFLDITPHERQFLIRFCFDRQLMMRKKGLE